MKDIHLKGGKMKKQKREEKTQRQQIIGYLRVSTADQDLKKNRADILQYANEHKLGNVDFVEETVSGKVSWRTRKIKDVIDTLDEGDWLITPELSRLGRSMLEIMEIISEAKQKGINIFAIKNNWNLNGSIESKILLMVFAMASEIEKDLISSRTKEALKARKKAGVILGRPKGVGKSKLDVYKDEIIALLKTGVPKTRVAKKYNSSLVNLYNWIGKNKLDVAVKE
jgi:DNA invertase Pin-like site-specific DNA recombinase